jgi:plastocyanin
MTADEATPRATELVSAPVEGTDGASGPGSRRSPYRRVAVVLITLMALAASGVAVVVAFRAATSKPAPPSSVHRFVIEQGTAKQIDLGAHYFEVPAVLRVTEGDELLVENRDDSPHVIGPITVRPGESISYTFNAAGFLQGACTVHPEEEMVIIVEERT